MADGHDTAKWRIVDPNNQASAVPVLCLLGFQGVNDRGSINVGLDFTEINSSKSVA